MTQEYLLEQLEIVLVAANEKCHVLEESVIEEFYEPVSIKITDSYTEFMSDKTSGVDTEEEIENILSTIPTTTIIERLSTKYYTKHDNPFYRLYHDIIISCFLGINSYNRGSKMYALVDKFYKFSTELILRACFKVGSDLLITGNEETIVETAYFKQVREQFDQISSSYTIPVESQFHISTQELLFFSSLLMKSPLDKRGDMLPHPDMEIIDVLPLEESSTVRASKLGAILPSISNVPEPTLPSTTIMSNFVHPNWYVLPATVWVKYADPEYKGFLPTINDAGALLDCTQRSIYWFEKTEYLKKWRQNEVKIKEQEQEKQEKQLEQLKSDIDLDKEQADREIPTDYQVSLDNLLSWSPTHYFNKEEYETLCKSLKDVQKLVNVYMLKLKRLQKTRLELGDMKPSTFEKALFKKIERMLKYILLHSSNVDKLAVKHVSEIPVLQANYVGNIPIVRQQPLVTHTQKKTKKYRKN